MPQSTAMAWQTRRTPAYFDLLAPDGSEIRLLTQVDQGSMVHCTLHAGQTSLAVRHRTVSELWYCVAGSGELWRRRGLDEEIVPLRPGTSASIPLGVEFQFRALTETLELVIVTMPPWPGEDEAVFVEGAWSRR
jgi:mannose-6-phosphate isomerase-like protein (cupin superfamily)